MDEQEAEHQPERGDHQPDPRQLADRGEAEPGGGAAAEVEGIGEQPAAAAREVRVTLELCAV